jgi:hypothetical protein
MRLAKLVVQVVVSCYLLVGSVWLALKLCAKAAGLTVGARGPNDQ